MSDQPAPPDDDAKADLAFVWLLALVLVCLTICFGAYRFTGGTWP